MANILTQEELDALLKEMKQLREDEVKEDIHINPAPIGRFQDHMSNQSNDVNLEMTLSLPVRVSAELGKASLSVQEILRLTQGSLIELDNKAKAPLRLVIKDQVIALGDVVLKDEKFAVRVTQIDPVKERIQKL
jgi:flagellar motor switch protein FliN/FliY